MKRLLILFLAVMVSQAVMAQQSEVPRYDLFTGYSYLTSPSVELGQHGFNTSFGVNVKRWVALGADFSIFTGDGIIPLSDTKVAATIEPFLPPGANPIIPFDAQTYTFAAGPQINIRKWDKITLFVRPGLGVLHERADLNVAPNLAPLISLIPGLTESVSDTVVFYGVGGGVDINLRRHIGMRVSVDFVRTGLFSDLLEPRSAVRISVGPTWKWGELR